MTNSIEMRSRRGRWATHANAQSADQAASELQAAGGAVLWYEVSPAVGSVAAH